MANVFIPADGLATSYLALMFRLRLPNSYIGQPLVAFLRLNPKPIAQSISQSVSVKNSQAADFSNMTDEKLLGMASMMLDEGYGTFDRCYAIVRCVRGELSAAKEITSQLMFHEAQFN